MLLVKLTLLCTSLVVGVLGWPTLVPTSSRGVQLDDQGNDCCQLEWLPLIERGTKRFIPSSAVGKVTKNATHWSYLMKPGNSRVAIISDEVEREPVFLDTPKGEGPWRGGYVLSNPNNCINGNIKIERGQVLEETSRRQFPSVNGNYFGGADEYIGYVYNSNRTKYGGSYLGQESGEIVSSTDFPWYHILYVDCRASLNNHLKAELFDIEFNVDKLLAKEHEEVATTEITNDSDNDQPANVDLSGHINSALKMTHESRLSTVASIEWATDASIKLNLIKELISLGAKEDWRLEELKEQFTRSGSLKLNSKATIYTFKQSIDMQPHTRAKVVIKTRPIRGTEKFTAHYRLRSNKPGMSDEQILRSLERIGFADVDRIKTVDGELVLTYDGEIAVDTGFDTHVLIESHSIIDGVSEGKILQDAFARL